MREWAADHRTALATIAAAIAVLLGLGWLHGRAMSWPLWHGEFCSLANGVTDGCDVGPATHYAYLVSALEYVTVVPLLAATFSLFTSRATSRHVRRHIDRRFGEKPLTISVESAGGMDDALMRAVRAQVVRRGPAVMTTRTMADATHDSVASLPAGLPVYAGYVTGSPDICWTPADWARFPAALHVPIDQGFTGAPQYSATVQDVETGAWSPSDVPGWQSKCTAKRPTVYCNRDTLPAVLATGWHGNLWLAIPGWKQGMALPAAPGCNIVAVQSVFDVNNAYDTSVILDPTWPQATGPKANELPNFFSSSRYTAISLGWGETPTLHPDTGYHVQIADMAGTVVFDTRTGATYAHAVVPAGGPYQWRLAVGQDAELAASPWSVWHPVP